MPISSILSESILGIAAIVIAAALAGHISPTSIR